LALKPQQQRARGSGPATEAVGGAQAEYPLGETRQAT